MQLSHTLKFCGVFNLSSKSKIMVHLPYVGLILTGRTDIPPACIWETALHTGDGHHYTQHEFSRGFIEMKRS